MIKRTVVAAMFASLLMASSAARATSDYEAEHPLTPFIYYWTFLNAGTQYTIETKNLTGGDTVLTIIYYNGTAWQQIAANDDNPFPRSKVVFTAPFSANYGIWVRSFNQGAGQRCDVAINGTTVLTQAEFGGVPASMTWSSGDQFRVAPTRFTNTSDD